MEEWDIGPTSAHLRKELRLKKGGDLFEKQGEVSTDLVEKSEFWNKLDLSPYLLSTALDGVQFQLLRRPRAGRWENYVPLENERAVDEKWEKWKKKGVLEKGETLLVMALGTVPKKNGKIRVIHDCRPINRLTPDMPFSLDGIGEVAKFLKRGDWMCKLDLEDGYEHVAIREDCRRYFGACWRGEILRFARLGFGFKLSPVLFQQLMEAIVRKVNEELVVLKIEAGAFVYLDDFLIRGPSEEKCKEALSLLMMWLERLGLKINMEKSVLDPCQEMEYLGKVWDTQLGKVFNGGERTKAMIADCITFLQMESIGLRELESFLGRLEWFARTLKLARCWKRSLMMELRAWKDRVRMVGLGVRGSGYSGRLTEHERNRKPFRGAGFFGKLSPASRRELKWWRDHGADWMAMDFAEVWSSRIKDIHVDASSYGYGSDNGLWGLWKAEEKGWNIALKEMEVLRRQVSKLPNGSKIWIGTDNSVVFWSWRRGRSFCWDINNLIRRIGGDIHARDLDVEVYWVPTWANRADEASRSWRRKGEETFQEEAKEAADTFLGPWEQIWERSGNWEPGKFRRNFGE